MLMDVHGIAKILSVHKDTVYKIAKQKKIKPAGKKIKTIHLPGANFPLSKTVNVYESEDFLKAS